MKKGDGIKSLHVIIRHSWVSLLSTIIAIGASILANMSIHAGLQKDRSTSVFIFLVFFALIFLMTIISAIIKRGPSRIALLKDKISGGYEKALDESLFNPSSEKGVKSV